MNIYTLTEDQLYTILNRTIKATSMDPYSDLSQEDFEKLKLRFSEELESNQAWFGFKLVFWRNK